jgi:serine/threonine-protein kinase
MDVLVCLAENPGEVVSKEDLLDRVWKVEHISDGTLSHAVADLRRALGDDARQPRYIETIRKRGYRLVARVESVCRIADQTAPRWLIRAAASVFLLAILAAATWIVAHRGGGEPPQPPRIVILPFENLGEEAHSHFAAGITDELISRLAAVRGLHVVSRTTAFNFDSTGKSARDIGRDLNVDYIVEGAVRWGADQEPPVIRITPQLIRVEDDSHLWSGRFNRYPESVLSVQCEIAQQIVAHLDLSLGNAENRVVNTPPTSDPVAYRAFLEALEHRGSVDLNEILIAVQMYRRAVEVDPHFAQAWAGLSEESGAIHHLRYDSAPEHCETARIALARARELAPEAPDTMRAFAFFEYQCQGDAAAARSAFERALQSWPGDALAMTGLAYACRRMGHWQDAEQWFRRALEIDPRNPTVLWELSTTLSLGHRYEEGLATVNRAIELSPDLRSAHFAKCLALWLGWGDTRQTADVLDRVPGSHDVTWYEYAFRNALFSGDPVAASRLAQDSPPGLLLQLHRCLAAGLAGAPEAAATCSEAASHYRGARDRNPDSLWPRLHLAVVYSLAGRHTEAETEAAAAVAMRPFETDAFGHTDALIAQAQVFGRAGRTEAAVALVEQLLSMPSNLSPAWLRIDPEWASIRHHPRIEEIISAGDPDRPDL